MTPEISQQLADLFGQIPLSQLPLGDGSPVIGEYVVYNQNDKLVYRIASSDLYTYLCRNVFRFVFDGMKSSATDEKSCILVNPQKYVQQGDTPITYARRLLQQVNKPNEMWIGEPAPVASASRKTNISQEWFKHFQYYYFDNLNNRQRTMLLTTAPGEYKEKTFDILIWIDASASMWNEIRDVADGIYDLCQIIFAQNPNNRVSIVQFKGNGYYNFVNGNSNFSKVNSVHLPFTNAAGRNGQSGITIISNFVNKLADWFENNSKVFDEVVWFTSQMAYPNFTFTPYPGQKDVWDETKNAESWNVGWENTRNGIPVNKMIVAISDEIEDPYASITGKLATAYKPGTSIPATPTFANPPISSKITKASEIPTAVWAYRPRSMFYRIVCPTETCWHHRIPPYLPSGTTTCPRCGASLANAERHYADPYCAYEEHDNPGHWKNYYPEFCNFATKYNWSGNGGGASNTGGIPDLGYDPSIHTIDAFVKGFRDNNVNFHFVYTGGAAAKNIENSNTNRYFENARVYIPRWEEDIISLMKTADGKQFGFLHLIEQTRVAETLADIFRNEATEGLACPWSNDMWYSHLEETTTQILPGVWKNPQEYTHLVVPKTAIVANSSKRTGHEFQKRNYTKIVTGGWDKNNADDKRWAAVSNVTVEPSPEVNDDIVDGRGEVVARNIGDIDQTLKVIGEFLDDVFLSIDPMEHTGQVVFTASKSVSPFGMGWHNVISSDDQNESFVWSGDTSLTGENENLVPGIPKHHHNTTFEDNDKVPISNVSIIGRPEGETVGGIAKVATAERLPTASYGKKEDSIHRISNTGAALNGLGAYNGTVEYDAYEVSATQQRHNNMPLYYKVRAFVHD